MDRHRAFGIALTIVSACAFGSGALFAKPVYADGVGWHTLMAWRFLIGAGLAWLWLLGSARRRAAFARLDRRAVLASLALGVLFTGNSATYFAGLETVDASLAALIVYIYPALVAVLSLRVGRALTGRRAWGALAIALVGAMLAVGAIEPSSAPPLSGIALLVASPVIYSVWIVLAARLSGERRTRVGDATTSGADPVAAMPLMMSATAATYWISGLVLSRPLLPGEVPGPAWLGILGVGVVSTFIAIEAFYGGAHRIGAAQAALVSTVEPVWTIVLASILLSESLSPLQLVGGALILAGVVVAQTAPEPPVTIAAPRLADE
jgi:drug/metabolite transporter (DMT)-like permease